MSPGCAIVRRPIDDGCQHTRRLVRAATLWVSNSMHLPIIHHDCIHNQIVSVHNRVCGVVPQPTKVGLEQVARATVAISHHLPTTVPDDYYVMPSLYSGDKRRRYEEATEQVLEGPISKRDAGVKMFVKGEKLKMDPNKPNPDPRAIQFRDAKYCVEISRYLKPIEHHLYNLSGVCKGVPPSRVVAKGLNQVERATLFMSKWRNFDDPVVVSLDASRFDKHVSIEMLKLEHRVYIRCCNDPHFRKLLSWQLRNKCRTSKGLRYKVAGRRMSGDMNTALGNCVIMIAMLMAWLRDCSKFDILDDGDDALVFLERVDLERLLARVESDFLNYGFKVRVEGVFDSPHKVEFCQSKIIEYEVGKYKFIRDPWKVMSTAMAGARHWSQLGARRRLVKAVGLCERVLNLGVPILQAYADALLRNSGRVMPLFMGEESSIMIRVRRELRTLGLNLHGVRSANITDEARLSFYEAYGVTSEEQITIENKLASWTFDITGMYWAPEEVDVRAWLQVPSDTPEVHP